jgi:hypothetical protein
MIGIYSAVLAASLAAGQTDTPLGELGDLLVGQWVGDASLIEQPTEENGKVPAKLTYRWILNGRALEGQWRRGKISGKWLVVWDPAAKVIKSMGARSDGNTWKGVIIKKGSNWIEETEGVLGGGSKVISRFVSVPQERGKRLVWEGEFSIDGKKQAPIRDVYEKVDGIVGSEGSEQAQLWREWRDYMIGEWETKGKLGEGFEGAVVKPGDKFRMHSSFRSAQGGRVVIGQQRFRIVGNMDFVATSHYVAGWDPVKKQIHAVAYWSDGDVDESTIYEKDGNVFRSHYTFKGGTGKKYSCTGLTKIVDQDTFHWKTSDSDAYTTSKRTKKGNARTRR